MHQAVPGLHLQAKALHDGEMRLPKPKSAPGLLLYFISLAALLLLVRIAGVLVGQNVETVSAEKGYDKLLSQHWTAIMDWFAVNGFWLSLATAGLVSAALALWANVILQPALVETRRSKRLNGMPVGKDGIPHPAGVRSEDRIWREKIVQRQYENAAFELPLVVDPDNPSVADRVFENCLFVGPSVAIFRNCKFNFCTFMHFTLPEENIIVVSEERAMKGFSGAIAFDRCEFKNCDFFRVTTLMLKEQAHEFLETAKVV